jgi:hypothetical protein
MAEYDLFPAEVRRRLRECEYNICSACLAGVIYKKGETVEAAMEAIDEFEATLQEMEVRGGWKEDNIG